MDEHFRWLHTIQSSILLFLFILWMFIGVFVVREVILVFLDHRKQKHKPTSKREYYGVYSVKRNRYLREKNYHPNSNGNEPIHA